MFIAVDAGVASTTLVGTVAVAVGLATAVFVRVAVGLISFSGVLKPYSGVTGFIPQEAANNPAKAMITQENNILGMPKLASPVSIRKKLIRHIAANLGKTWLDHNIHQFS